MYQPSQERIDRRDLERLQLERLRITIGRIQGRNPRYHAHLGRIRPSDLTTLTDLPKLPFLTKGALRDAYPFGLACARTEECLRIQMSSGTTGNPIINPYTRGDVEQWKEVMARCYRAVGVARGDVIQVTPSFGLFTGGFGFHYGAEAIGAMVIPIGAGRTLLQLQLMRDLGATAITAIATYPLRLMEVAAAEGFDFRSTKLRVGIFGSEMWTDHLRRRIEEGMGIRAFDIIGMTETGGPGMGIDCEARQGMHVWEDHYLVEIIDPESGEARPDGAEGEMVVTTLTREGLPLVRYRTGDLTRVLSRERCPCGRTHLRLDRLKGRTDDMVIFKGINFYPQQIETILLRHASLGHEYQIRLERDEAGMDRLTLVVEVSKGLDAREEERIRREIHDLLSLSPEFRFVKEGEIPRPVGKAIRVLDRRRG